MKHVAITSLFSLITTTKQKNHFLPTMPVMFSEPSPLSSVNVTSASEAEEGEGEGEGDDEM